MTFTPDADKPASEIRCPMGFTVQPVRKETHECGHLLCVPASCALLRQQKIDFKCVEDNK